MHPLQRRLPLRRAARLRAPRRGCACSRPATTRASSSATGSCCSRARPIRDKDQSYMLARPRPPPARAHRLPARRPDEGRDPRRGRRAPGSPPRARPRARRRASSAATTTAPSSSAAACAARRAGRRPTTARSSARTTATGASRRASARASGSRPASRSTRCAPTPRTNTLVVGPRGALARDRVSVRGRLLRACDAGRGEAPLPLARGRRPVEPTARGFRLELDEPAYGVAPGQTAVLYDGRRRRRRRNRSRRGIESRPWRSR